MAEIEFDGFDELESLLQEMTIDEADERRAMKKAIDIIGDEVDRNTPVGATQRLKKSLKRQVTKEGFATVGIVRFGVFYDLFQEFGTSRSKKNVGFFERSVNNTQDEALSVLANELLK